MRLHLKHQTTQTAQNKSKGACGPLSPSSAPFPSRNNKPLRAAAAAGVCGGGGGGGGGGGVRLSGESA